MRGVFSRRCVMRALRFSDYVNLAAGRMLCGFFCKKRTVNEKMHLFMYTNQWYNGRDLGAFNSIP